AGCGAERHGRAGQAGAAARLARTNLRQLGHLRRFFPRSDSIAAKIIATEGAPGHPGAPSVAQGSPARPTGPADPLPLLPRRPALRLVAVARNKTCDRFHDSPLTEPEPSARWTMPQYSKAALTSRFGFRPRPG